MDHRSFLIAPSSAAGRAAAGELPPGVRLGRLVTHADSRGDLTEIFRAEWGVGMEPVQWNLVHSRADVLRGVHVHHRHSDYLLLVRGAMRLLLHDIRSDSPSRGGTVMLEVTSAPLTPITIPPGVAHGFWFSEDSTHIYAVSHYWNLADEIGCAWNAPELDAAWPAVRPTLSARDAALGGYRAMVDAYEAARRSLAS
jgi:dTDP-4-dehydrorhamnose 3,5-epimerase